MGDNKPYIMSCRLHKSVDNMATFYFYHEILIFLFPSFITTEWLNIGKIMATPQIKIPNRHPTKLTIFRWGEDPNLWWTMPRKCTVILQSGLKETNPNKQDSSHSITPCPVLSKKIELLKSCGWVVLGFKIVRGGGGWLQVLSQWFT